MKHQKTYIKAIIMILCICINYAGKAIASNLNLPIWMDSFGTIVVAYLYGPICGAIIGVTNNIIYGFTDPVSFIYGIVSIAIGIIVGISARKRVFDNVFNVYTAGIVVTTVSVVLSTVINLALYNGTTGNIWGDGVINYLEISGIPHIVSCFIGEFYVDLLDKVLLLFLMYLLLKLYRKHRDKLEKNLTSIIKTSILLFASAAVLLSNKIDSKAAEDISKQSYIGTIYNNENGLPCGEANDVEHTPDGVLWIGTYAGLYRYTGNSFEIMDKFPSVKNVNCLYVDEEGRLWIGTNDNGLSICVNGEIVNVVDSSLGLPSNSVRSIVQSSDGLYYIGTSDYMQVISLNGGLNMLNIIEGVNYAMSTAADDNGNVAAVSTSGELFIINNQKVIFRQKIGFGQEDYTSCYFDENGTLYVGTSKNMIHCYKVAGSWVEEKAQIECEDLYNINAIVSDENGGFIVCADNGVGCVNSDGKYSRLRTGAFNNSIDNMTFDYQGNMWFASSRLGLYRMSQSVLVDYYSELELPKKVVNAVVLHRGKLYVGTDTGLDIVDIKAKTTMSNYLIDELDGKRIRDIVVDSNNEMWICTYNDGLWHVKGDETILFNTNNSQIGDRARAAIELKDGVIAAATDRGLSFIKDDEVINHLKMGDDIGNSMILNLMETADGTLYVGTDGDGIVVVKNQKVVERIKKRHGISSDVILRVVDDKMGPGVFVVTSNGLCYLEDDKARILDAFPYSNNYDIWMNDEGKLFVLGSAGVYIVDRNELLEGQLIDYEILDVKKGLTNALTANAWNYFDGRYLYLPCESGVVQLDTKRIHGAIKSYRMMLTSVKLDNVDFTVERNEPLIISNNVNKIEIRPEVLNYTAQEPYVQYYLEGFDTQKVLLPLSDLSTIVYTNVPSGQYVLHIAVLEAKNGAVLEESTYKFIKEKEIYENMWFRAYMIIVLVLAVAWLTWFIAKTRVQKTLEMQRKEIELAKKQVEMGNQTILAIAKTVDARDKNTANHSLRVSEYAVMIAKEYGYSEENCEILRQTALLHDIGKIGIPDSILNKPAKLDDDEYMIMKSHVIKGAEILKDFTIVDNVWEGALYHHERYDGKGYMHGLRGKEIPINARIIGIADAFDAMTANRVYRKKIDFDHVLNELRKGRATQFDPEFVDILLHLIDTKQIDVESLYREEEE